jgi:hypothetical protein
VRHCERLVELDGRLPGFLEGMTTPADPDERIELAELCTLKRLHRAAARFYKEALAAQPKLAGAHRYNAACAAALAGCGQGKDANKLDEKERARLLRLALDWLRADLTVWRKHWESKEAKVRPIVRQKMLDWLADTDFAGVRGPALSKLPEGERQSWDQLWREVEDLRRQAAAPSRK